MIRLAYAAKELHLLLGLRLGLSLASLLQLLIPFASPLALTAGAIVIGDAQLGAQYITGIRISCVQLTKSGSYPFVGIGYTGGENPTKILYLCQVRFPFYLRSWATTFWQFISGFLLAPLSKYENLFRSNSHVSSDFILSSVQFYSSKKRIYVGLYVGEALDT